MAAITGHTLKSVTQIIEHYLVLTGELPRAAFQLPAPGRAAENAMGKGQTRRVGTGPTKTESPLIPRAPPADSTSAGRPRGGFGLPFFVGAMAFHGQNEGGTCDDPKGCISDAHVTTSPW
jgi:hypothetical protein